MVVYIKLAPSPELCDVCKLARAHRVLVILALAGTALCIIYLLYHILLDLLNVEEEPYHTC
jgi:hypothetical protein